jgi:hypothetical protein
MRDGAVFGSHMIRSLPKAISIALLALLVSCADGDTQGNSKLVLGFSQLLAVASWNAANTESIR